MYHFCSRGSDPDPAERDYSAPPLRPLADFRNCFTADRTGKKREGKEWKGEEGEKREIKENVWTALASCVPLKLSPVLKLLVDCGMPPIT